MIRFINFPPRDAGDIALSEHTCRELQTSLNTYISPEAIDDDDIGAQVTSDFWDEGVSVGITLATNVGDVEHPLELSKDLARSALGAAFETLDPVLEEAFITGIEEGAEKEIFARQVSRLEY